MQTFKRICIQEQDYQDPDDPSRMVKLQRGKEYITSAEKEGQVFVFSSYWFWAPVSLFAGAEEFTGG